MSDVNEILVKFLEENGFDGLCNGDIECGCKKDDLAPCDSNFMDCKPAYISKTPPDGYDLWLTTEPQD